MNVNYAMTQIAVQVAPNLNGRGGLTRARFYETIGKMGGVRYLLAIHLTWQRLSEMGNVNYMEKEKDARVRANCMNGKGKTPTLYG